MSQSTMRLQSFDLASRDIAAVDGESLHGLSLGVEWPHRPADWDLLRSVGRGFVALDEIGRVFSSAMWFPYGADCATIGMVITSPRVQTHGGGRWMMEGILQQCGERRLILNATRAAYSLYVSLGFVPQATVYQCQGYARAVAAQGDAVETVEGDDLAEVAALDAAAFGADRSALMARLAAVSEIRGLRRGGRLVGFAMRRPFGRGQVIGPVVAGSDEEAAQLVSALLAGLDGQFVRVDTRQADGALRTVLHAAGLSLHDTVTTMTRGAPLPKVAPGSPGTYALAAHALS